MKKNAVPQRPKPWLANIILKKQAYATTPEEKKKWSYQGISDAVDITRGYLYRVIKGQRSVSEFTANRLGRLLGFETSRLWKKPPVKRIKED